MLIPICACKDFRWKHWRRCGAIAVASSLPDRKLYCERHMRQRICNARGKPPKNPPQALLGRIRADAEAAMSARP